jgi:hypothetical protein
MGFRRSCWRGAIAEAGRRRTLPRRRRRRCAVAVVALLASPNSVGFRAVAAADGHSRAFSCGTPCSWCVYSRVLVGWARRGLVDGWGEEDRSGQRARSAGEGDRVRDSGQEMVYCGLVAIDVRCVWGRARREKKSATRRCRAVAHRHPATQTATARFALRLPPPRPPHLTHNFSRPPFRSRRPLRRPLPFRSRICLAHTTRAPAPNQKGARQPETERALFSSPRSPQAMPRPSS